MTSVAWICYHATMPGETEAAVFVPGAAWPPRAPAGSKFPDRDGPAARRTQIRP